MTEARTLTLAGFLLARIAEEAALARGSHSTLLIANLDLCAVPGSDHQATLRHHERWEPRRVLAECEAKRRIVERYAEHAEYDDEENSYEHATGRIVGLGEAVRLLAAPYADHPDYREEWRPLGSRLVTDMATGEQRIEPPAEPVSPEQFMRRRPS